MSAKQERLLEADLRRSVAAGLVARGFQVRVEEKVKTATQANMHWPEGSVQVLVYASLGDHEVDAVQHGDLTVNEMRSNEGFRRPPTGKYCVTVGPYGDRRTFRLGAKGWNMEGILEQVSTVLRRAIATKAQEASRRNNADVANEVKQKLTAQESYLLGVSASSSPTAPVRLSFKLDTNLTADRAEEVIAGLRSLGLI